MRKLSLLGTRTSFQSCVVRRSLHGSISTVPLTRSRHGPKPLGPLRLTTSATVVSTAYAGCAPDAPITRRPGTKPRSRPRGTRWNHRRITCHLQVKNDAFIGGFAFEHRTNHFCQQQSSHRSVTKLVQTGTGAPGTLGKKRCQSAKASGACCVVIALRPT